MTVTQPARRGRPPLITPDGIAAAGVRVTLEKLTVKAVAAELGVTAMALYQHIDGLDGLRHMVAGEVMRRRPALTVSGTDLAGDLLALAVGLRRFLHEYPGIGIYLARIDSTSTDALAVIDAEHARFAAAYDLTPTQAAWLVSTVAEHAIALATVIYTPEGRPRHAPDAIAHRDDLNNLRQVAIRRVDHDDDWFFTWSMRATVVGTIELIAGLP